MSLIALLLIQAVPAAPAVKPAPHPEPVCVRAGDLPPGFAAWRDAPGQPGVGHPFIVTGAAPAALKLSPARPGQAAVVAFEINAPGIYRVGLSDSGWIDVRADGAVLTSTGHGHGPACTGLRKIVDFKLADGKYTLQLTGMSVPQITVMIVPAR